MIKDTSEGFSLNDCYMFLRKDRSEGKFPPAIIVVAHQFSIYNTHFNLSLLYKSKCRQETHDLKI